MAWMLYLNVSFTKLQTYIHSLQPRIIHAGNRQRSTSASGPDIQNGPEFHILTLRHVCILLAPVLYPPPTMSSRINIARPSQQSYHADPHGLSNSRPSSSSTGYRAANPDDPVEKLRAFSKTVEDNVAIYAQPLKPHLPAIGRFLIVVTFLEDALRIVTQWNDQIWYLQR